MHGGHRSVVALRHGVAHRHHFGAADLADDYPVRGHAQCPADQFGLRHRPFAFDVGFAGLQCDHVRVPGRVFVQAEFEGVFDGDQPLGWVDLTRQAT